MVGGIGPGDDPLQLTGRADVPGADAGRRQAGSARPMVLAAGAWITGRDTGSDLGVGRIRPCPLHGGCPV